MSNSGIISINGLNNQNQFLNVGSMGNDFNIVDNSLGIHTFNIPDASISNRGFINNFFQIIGGEKSSNDNIHTQNIYNSIIFK